MKSKFNVTTHADGTKWFSHLQIITRAEIPPAGPGDIPDNISEDELQGLIPLEDRLLEAEGLPRYQRYLRRHRD